jgi:transcriptional regulator with XRE-family HTH domain
MDTFAKRLRERAEQLGISNAEAARRAGLDERRYAHYASGRREPDLATLVKIADTLGTHPTGCLASPWLAVKTRNSQLLSTASQMQPMACR